MLQDRVDTWVTPSHGSQRYYWYSGCCTRTQGRGLIIDPVAGVPTCRAGLPASRCRKDQWKQKLYGELLGNGSNYDYMIPPSLPKAAYNASAYNCICEASDPRCVRRSADGSRCQVCETGDACGPLSVQVGLNFFKIREVSLISSQLQLSVWMRQIWDDHRLDFDPRCYGDTSEISIQNKQGTLEETTTWVPDVELVNSEEPFTQSVAPQKMILYGCWDGTPSRGGCGNTFFSTPFTLKALCRYLGIVDFPYDRLRCELEIAGWSLDGKKQDIIPRTKTGGISWVDDPNSFSLSGLTAGSTYQNYKIAGISVKRLVAQYDASSGVPWPALVYTLEFDRAASWYKTVVVAPMAVLGILGQLMFWVSPDTEERLGTAILLVLALIWHDITVASLMPICSERLFLNYLSLTCIGFACFAVVESAVVLWLHHQQAATWRKVLLPRIVRKFFDRKIAAPQNAEDVARHATTLAHKRRQSQATTHQASLRGQAFRMMFEELDDDGSGLIDSEEFIEFAQFFMGSNYRNVTDAAFLRFEDSNNDPRFITYHDFVNFCETKVEHMEDTAFLTRTAHLFLESSRWRRDALKKSWMQVAETIDFWARFASPIGVATVMIGLFSMTPQDLEDMRFNLKNQMWLLALPVWPMLSLAVPFVVLEVRYVRKMAYLHLLEKAAKLGRRMMMPIADEEEIERLSRMPLFDKKTQSFLHQEADDEVAGSCEVASQAPSLGSSEGDVGAVILPKSRTEERPRLRNATAFGDNTQWCRV